MQVYLLSHRIWVTLYLKDGDESVTQAVVSCDDDDLQNKNTAFSVQGYASFDFLMVTHHVLHSKPTMIFKPSERHVILHCTRRGVNFAMCL